MLIMLKAVNRQDHVRFLASVSGKDATIRNPCPCRRQAGKFQSTFPDIDPDDPSRPVLRGFDCFCADAAPEIDHHPSGQRRPNIRSEQHLEFAATAVSAAVASALPRSTRADGPEQVITQGSTDNADPTHKVAPWGSGSPKRTCSSPWPNTKPTIPRPSSISGEAAGGEVSGSPTGRRSVTIRSGRRATAE